MLLWTLGHGRTCHGITGNTSMPGADYLRAQVHSNNAIERGTAAHRAHAMGRNP